ncbi:UDP-2,4-diacetamido-2,4,6-trideoxy-beta-L-altropyranose hydrolase [Desulfosporosinus fructosivorans]
MKVVFRVDASVPLGSGHIMRCITLAKSMDRRGAEICFICREVSGHLCGILEQASFRVIKIKNTSVVEEEFDWEVDAQFVQKFLAQGNQRVDWLVIDHYQLDARWEKLMRPYTRKIMVIDDLADRTHDCDLLLDQNYYGGLCTRYEGLVSRECLLLLGPKYVLLRPEFYEARRNLRPRDGALRRILVFFGGSDPTNETAKALKAIRLLQNSDIYVDVIVGSANPFKEMIGLMCKSMANTSFYCQVENMAEIMVGSDIAIGAGGTATWERCFLGLPALVIIIADNQKVVTEAVATTGSTLNLGTSEEVDADKIVDALLRLSTNPKLLQSMSDEGIRLMGALEHQGVELILQAMEDECIAK